MRRSSSYLPLVLLLLGVVLFGFSTRAISAERSYLTVPRPDTDRSKPVSRLLGLGWDAYKEGDYKEAEFFFQKAFEMDPSSNEALYGLSWTFFKEGKSQDAIKGFSSLFQRGFRKKEVGRALFYLFLRLNERKMARRYLPYLTPDEQKRYKRLFAKGRKGKRGAPKPRRTAYKSNKNRINKKDELSAFFLLSKEQEWNRLVELYERLSRDERARRDVRKIMGWALFNVGKVSQAKKVFHDLLLDIPQNQEVAYALALCCSKLGDLDCVIFLHERFPMNKKIQALSCSLIGKEISTSYEKGNYKKVLEIYGRFSDSRCFDEDESLRELVAWAALKEKRFSLSSRLFEGFLKKKDHSKALYKGLLASLSGLGQEKRQWQLVESLSHSKKQEDRELAADFYYHKGMPERADFIYPSHKKVYFNSSSPFGETGYTYSHLDGDKGTSRLNVQEIPVFKVGFHPSEKISVSLGGSNLLVQSGATGEGPWLGTPSMGTSIYKPCSSVKAFMPFVTLHYHDRWQFKGSLSSTPIGGEVGAIPLFELEMKKSGQEEDVTLFQRSVTRSLLSWSGQRDPYTGKDWGRVVSTGIFAKKGINLRKKWWLSLQGSYAHLWGDDVLQNTMVSGGLAIGKSEKCRLFQHLSYGVFTTIIHFDRNSNFYTFGHGGYFSPQFFMATGPFFHAVTPAGKRWMLDLSGSMSYLNYYEKESSFYPISSSFNGKYPSDHSSKLGYSLNLSGAVLFSPRVIGKVILGTDQSADYRQYQVGVFLTFYFGNRTGLLPGDLKQREELLSNKGL